MHRRTANPLTTQLLLEMDQEQQGMGMNNKNPDMGYPISNAAEDVNTNRYSKGCESMDDAANLLKPALSRGQLQLIGATTISAFSLKNPNILQTLTRVICGID